MTLHPHLAEVEHTVYGCYGKDDRLLYIGCAHDLDRRVWEHTTDNGWWGEVARVEILAARPTRAEGWAAETELIQKLRPAYNQQRKIHRSKWTLDDYVGTIAGYMKMSPNAFLCQRHLNYIREIDVRFGIELPTHSRSALLHELNRLLAREPVERAA